MAKQMLLYETVVPVTVERHRTWSLERGADYSYSAHLNACPLMVSEFRAAAANLAIVFSRAENGMMPAVVLGMETDKSAMVDARGQWSGRYIPAFLRRYPFVFAAASKESEQFTLCLDESFSGLDQQGVRGERLFTDDGEPTKTMSDALDFTKNFEVENRRTQAFTKLLADNDLVIPMNAQITLADGSKRALTGFSTISRDKLKALDSDTVKMLFDSDALELIYLHLSSLANLEQIASA